MRVGKDMIEIRIGKSSFPLVSIARVENDDYIVVFVNNGLFWGQSIKTKAIAQLRFKNGKTTWGGKVVRFI
jgi:hypothetical protein